MCKTKISHNHLASFADCHTLTRKSTLVPRDRDRSFEPELVKKGQTRIDSMQGKIIDCPAGDCKAICREGPLRLRFDGARHPCLS